MKNIRLFMDGEHYTKFAEFSEFNHVGVLFIKHIYDRLTGCVDKFGW